jgi:hypothetical protein
LECSKKCKETFSDELEKWKQNRKKGTCTEACDNIWDPVCGESGKMYDNNCLLNCNGEKNRFYCSDKGLSFDDGRCRQFCRENARIKEVQEDTKEINVSRNNNNVESSNLEYTIDQDSENKDSKRVSIGKNSFQTIEVNNENITVLRQGETFSIPNSGSIKGSNLKIKESNNKKSSSQIRSSSGFEKNLRKNKNNFKIKKNKDKFQEKSKKLFKTKKQNMKKNKNKKEKKKLKRSPKKQNKKKDEANKKTPKLTKNNKSLDPGSFKNTKNCLEKCNNKNKKKVVCFSNGKLYVDLCKPACKKLSSLFVCPKNLTLKKCLLQCRQKAKQI